MKKQLRTLSLVLLSLICVSIGARAQITFTTTDGFECSVPEGESYATIVGYSGIASSITIPSYASNPQNADGAGYEINAIESLGSNSTIQKISFDERWNVDKTNTINGNFIQGLSKLVILDVQNLSSTITFSSAINYPSSLVIVSGNEELTQKMSIPDNVYVGSTDYYISNGFIIENWEIIVAYVGTENTISLPVELEVDGQTTEFSEMFIYDVIYTNNAVTQINGLSNISNDMLNEAFFLSFPSLSKLGVPYYYMVEMASAENESLANKTIEYIGDTLTIADFEYIFYDSSTLALTSYKGTETEIEIPYIATDPNSDIRYEQPNILSLGNNSSVRKVSFASEWSSANFIAFNGNFTTGLSNLLIVDMKNVNILEVNGDYSWPASLIVVRVNQEIYTNETLGLNNNVTIAYSGDYYIANNYIIENMESVVYYFGTGTEINLPIIVNKDGSEFTISDIYPIATIASVTKLGISGYLSPDILNTLIEKMPNLKTIGNKYYAPLSELKNYDDIVSNNINIVYDGETYTNGDLLLGDYDENSKIWLGFSDTAEGYVTASNRDADGNDIFYSVGVLQPSEKVTHIIVDMSDFSGELFEGAYTQLTNLKGIYFKEDILYDNYTEYLPQGVAIFGDETSMMSAYENFHSATFSSFQIAEDDETYPLNGLILSGSIEDGATVTGYNGTLNGIDLSEAKVQYYGWDVDIRQIDALCRTDNSATTLKLVILPCSTSVWVNGQALYNMTGTAPSSQTVEEAPIVSIIHDCTEMLDLSNSMQLLDNAALIFVNNSLLTEYQSMYADYADKFVDASIINSAEENIVYDPETQTLEVALNAETDLTQLSNIVNSGAAITDVVLIKLTDDIDLTAEANPQQWSTLGTAEAPFNGTFNGQGYTLTIGTAEQQTEASTLFGNVGKDGKVENLNIEGVNYEADNNGGKEMIGDGEDESKKYFALLAETNDGVLSNIVVTGSVQAEEDIEGNIVACIVADNQGEMDHVVGYFEGLDETADSNKRCILVSQNVGVGRNAGKASKICSNTKQQANKRLTLGDNIDKQPLDVNDDIRYYNNTEMASGEPAYWLNFYDKGYSGEYTREWSKGTKYPIVADANHKPAVKLIYAIEGATATEVGLKNMVYYANEGDQITLETTQAPGEVIVNGSKQNNISKKMTITLNGQAATDGTITITLKYGTTPVPIIEINNTINISATNRQITIRNAANQPFSIYNIKGQEVLHGIVNSNLQQLLIPEIGVYIVKVADTTKKVVIR